MRGIFAPVWSRANQLQHEYARPWYSGAIIPSARTLRFRHRIIKPSPIKTFGGDAFSDTPQFAPGSSSGLAWIPDRSIRE